MKKKSKAHKKSSLKVVAKQLTKLVWPQERDFFERPDRYRYVRKLLPQEGCVFCANDALTLVKDDKVMVVMNKYPYNTGHLLILPRQHIGDLWSLPRDVNERMAHWLQVSARILTEELGCQGLNLGMNHGAVAGAGIPDHLHWHIVPRWAGDTNFFPLIAETKALPATVEQIFDRLKPHFAKELR